MLRARIEAASSVVLNAVVQVICIYQRLHAIKNTAQRNVEILCPAQSPSSSRRIQMNCPLCNSFRRPGPDPSGNPRAIDPKVGLTWRDLCLSSETCYCCKILLDGCAGCVTQHGLADVEDLDLRFYYDNPDVQVERDCRKLIDLRFASGCKFSIEVFTLNGRVSNSTTIAGTSADTLS